MNTSSDIHTTIDGTSVHGRCIHRSESEIAVAIDSPLPGFTLSIHCVPMGGEGEAETGWSGPTGEKVGESLLKHLHRLTTYLVDNRVKLIAAWAEYAARTRELRNSTDLLTDNYFALAAENLYKDLEADRITYQQHESKMTEYRVMHSRYHEQAKKLRDQFFRENFPFELQESAEGQVLVWLRRESDSDSSAE